MKRYVIAVGLSVAVLSSVATADNIANCEVVLMEPVLENDEPTGAEIASFRPADDFMSSIYDEDEAHLDNVDGYPIRAVLCQRQNVIPTARDFPVIATGLPFSLSNNFDSPDSALLTVYFKDGVFQHKYLGRELGERDAAALSDVMEVFNLQEHKLGQ